MKDETIEWDSNPLYYRCIKGIRTFVRDVQKIYRKLVSLPFTSDTHTRCPVSRFSHMNYRKAQMCKYLVEVSYQTSVSGGGTKSSLTRRKNLYHIMVRQTVIRHFLPVISHTWRRYRHDYSHTSSQTAWVSTDPWVTTPCFSSESVVSQI